MTIEEMYVKARSTKKPRVRAFKPKSVTGCKTCRIRRIKCDEAKPHCLRCTSTGRRCDGYTVQMHHIIYADFCHSDAVLPSQIISVNPFSSHPTCAQETRSFAFFREHTSHQISNTFDADFWRYLVLQASHHESAIRHAACALGAMHEWFERSSPRDGRLVTEEGTGDFALHQYSKAINCLLEPVKNNRRQAADVALMTCIMFICFETLRGNYGMAFSHIDGGVKIIAELQPNQDSGSTSDLSLSPVPYITLSTLNLMFIRIDKHATSVHAATRKCRLLRVNIDDHDAGYEQRIPRTFSSLEEARNSLSYIHTGIARAIPPERPTIPFDSDERAKIMVTLDLRRSVGSLNLKLWDQALQSYIDHNINKIDDPTKEAILMLKMEKLLHGNVFKVDSLKALHDETAWDGLQVDFEAILSLATEYIDLTSKSITKKVSFNFDGGVIYPLCLVAVKCRDYYIRRRAITLLRSSERVEGVMNSLLTAKLSERLMEIEEMGVQYGTDASLSREAKCVPKENRLAGFEIAFSMENRKAYVKYGKFVPFNEGHELKTRPFVVAEEWIEW